MSHYNLKQYADVIENYEKSQIKESASVVHLVQMWKEEESRKKLIALAELRKKGVKKEIKKLSSMDEVKARIMGISEDEVLNG